MSEKRGGHEMASLSPKEPKFQRTDKEVLVFNSFTTVPPAL
jgi:hypothetical protein